MKALKRTLNQNTIIIQCYNFKDKREAKKKKSNNKRKITQKKIRIYKQTLNVNPCNKMNEKPKPKISSYYRIFLRKWFILLGVNDKKTVLRIAIFEFSYLKYIKNDQCEMFECVW